MIDLNPCNPENEYDFIGQYHNEALEFYQEDPETLSNVKNITDVVHKLVYIACEYAFSREYPLGQKEETQEEIARRLNITPSFYHNIFRGREEKQNFVSSIDLGTSEATESYLSLINLMYNQRLDNESDVNSALDMYREYESSIRDQEWMQNENVKILFNSSVSVARYSTAYWFNEKSNPDSFWRNFKFHLPDGCNLPANDSLERKDVSEYVSADVCSVLGSAWLGVLGGPITMGGVLAGGVVGTALYALDDAV